MGFFSAVTKPLLILLLCLFFYRGYNKFDKKNINSCRTLVYTRQLFLLRTLGPARTILPIPVELKRDTGATKLVPREKARLAATQWNFNFKPLVPSIIMGNVNIIPNKMDELAPSSEECQRV